MICHSLGLNIRQRRNMSRRNLFSLLCHTRNLSLIFGLSARFFFGYLVFRAISWLTNKGKPNMIGLLWDFPLVQTGTSSHLEIIRIYHLEPSFKMVRQFCSLSLKYKCDGLPIHSLWGMMEQSQENFLTRTISIFPVSVTFKASTIPQKTSFSLPKKEKK